MIYIAVLCNSTESLPNRSTILPLFTGPYTAATVRRFSTKALARYQVLLLGEQRHIRCEQLVQGCCANNAAAGVEPATSRSQVRRPTTTLHSSATYPHQAMSVNASPASMTYSDACSPRGNCLACIHLEAVFLLPRPRAFSRPRLVV